MRALSFASVILAVACSSGTGDVKSTVGSCELTGTAAACSASTAEVTAGKNIAGATRIASGVTYDVAPPPAGGLGYVLVIPEASGTHTFYFGEQRPLEVCDETATCASEITDCPAFRHVEQYELIGGALYEIEADTRYTVHVAAPGDDGGGDGDGTVRLGDPQTYMAGTTPSYVTAGDLDGDDVLDLVVSTPDDASGLTTVDLLQGDGDGGFAMVDQIDTSAPGEIVVADFDGDGTADIAGVAFDGQGPLPHFYLRGLGAFMFDPLTTWGAGYEIGPRLASADLDGDGAPELLAPYASGFLIVQPPSFATLDEEMVGDPLGRSIAAGDFDGDGDQDVVEAIGDSSTLRLYTGDGSGGVTFAGETVIDGPAIVQLAAFDLDADGIDDVVALHAEGAATISYGSATGFSAPVVLGIGGPVRGVGAGDFDHSGSLDLAIGTFTSSTESSIVVFLSTDRTFRQAGTLAVPDTGYRGDIAVGDFDSDGFDDLAVPTLGGVAVFLSTP